VLEAEGPGVGGFTSYAGPAVFKMTSVTRTDNLRDPANPGRIKYTVDFFWEDRLAPTSYRPVEVEKVIDHAGNPVEALGGVEMTIGNGSGWGGAHTQLLDMPGGVFWGQLSFYLPSPVGKAEAFAEISGKVTLVRSTGKMELRIEDALAEGEEKSAEKDGYKLTITKVERRGGVVTSVTTEFTKDGKPVELSWPSRGGWSLVDAEGKTIAGHLMGGHMVVLGGRPEENKAYTLVRVFAPDVTEQVYRFKFTQVPVP